MQNWTRRTLLRSAALGTAAVGLAACGSDDEAVESTGSPDEVAAALAAGGTLTVWGWEPTLEAVVEGFQAKHPNVTVNLVNAGTGNDQYTALQNAVKAGKGGPDVAHIEYFALPQFVLAQSVADISAFGASALGDTFSTGPWSSVQSGEGIYGLPMDSGPMAMFYNKATFDRLGVALPTTWDEYLEAARALHAADPTVYITADTGDAGAATSMLWQVGDKPFSVDGENVTVDLQGPGAQRYAEIWDVMISEQLVSPIVGWTDEWFQGLANGTLATLNVGAWMPANLESSAPAGAGQWAVAPMPQWEAGGTSTAENGGSGLSIMQASTNKALAYAFLDYSNVGEGVQIKVDGGAFPASKAVLESEEFLNKEFPYFGGQKANEVLSESAAGVVPDWSYLPFQVYANTIYADTAGQAYNGGTDVMGGLKAWQDAIVEYGNAQGFTVT